ncbi:MAG: DUF3006 domain-containing protein [Bacillota bacterium]|nr:DUF3006 domain-containing protein [Bacillota bacterium]
MASIIDRFEGCWAIIEHAGGFFNFPKDLLPAGAHEGDVIVFDITVDKAATAERRRKIQELENDLFDKPSCQDGA